METIRVRVVYPEGTFHFYSIPENEIHTFTETQNAKGNIVAIMGKERITIERGEDWHTAYNARRNRERTYNVSVRKHNADSVTVVCGYSGNVRNATVLCDENSLEYATRAIGEHLAKLYADNNNAPRRVLVTLD